MKKKQKNNRPEIKINKLYSRTAIGSLTSKASNIGFSDKTFLDTERNARHKVTQKKLLEILENSALDSSHEIKFLKNATAFPLNIKKKNTSRKYKIDIKNKKRQLDNKNIYDILNKVLQEPNLQLNPITHPNAESFHKYLEDTNAMKNVNEEENSDFLCDLDAIKLTGEKELSNW